MLLYAVTRYYEIIASFEGGNRAFRSDWIGPAFVSIVVGVIMVGILFSAWFPTAASNDTLADQRRSLLLHSDSHISLALDTPSNKASRRVRRSKTSAAENSELERALQEEAGTVLATGFT